MTVKPGEYAKVGDKRSRVRRESEEPYRTLLFRAGIGIWYWSTDGALMYFNEISLQRLKGKEQNFMGKNLRDLSPDADAVTYSGPLGGVV